MNFRINIRMNLLLATLTLKSKVRTSFIKFFKKLLKLLFFMSPNKNNVISTTKSDHWFVVLTF